MTDELKRLQMVAECKQLEPQQMSKLTLLRCAMLCLMLDYNTVSNLVRQEKVEMNTIRYIVN